MTPSIRHALLLAAALTTTLAAAPDKTSPLVIKEQGSFFVGGRNKTVSQPASGPIPAQTGEITVNQMYVQYQIPMKGDQHVPVVMVHGCCLSSKTWETTPDGRMGWRQYFERNDRSVYLADQVSRARSGFDPTPFASARDGRTPASKMPGILDATHEIAWTVFRFGPKYGQTFPDEQFPVQAVGELYKQMIPDLNSELPTPNPTWTQMAALGVKLKGAVLMGHSESGFFPEEAALIDPSGVRGIVSIEMPCRALSQAEVQKVAKIPSLFIFGDHLADVTGGPVNWQQSLDGCKALVDRLKKAGGDATMMHLPEMGIKGNSHMLMQDRNSDRIADLVIAWLDQHVDRKARTANSTR